MIIFSVVSSMLFVPGSEYYTPGGQAGFGVRGGSGYARKQQRSSRCLAHIRKKLEHSGSTAPAEVSLQKPDESSTLHEWILQHFPIA